MTTILLHDIHTLVTMDDQLRELQNASIFIEDGVIVAIGQAQDMPDRPADLRLSMAQHLVLPGLINTHHHMYQSLTRAVAPDAELFGWLKTLYPIWAQMKPEHIQVSTRLSVAELLLSGCTTSSDHLYIFPNGCRLDDEIEAAQAMKIRFHATRGSMSVGESKGGLPPDRVVEEESNILHDTRRLIETYHRPQRYSMMRVGVAPCSPFSVSRDLMQESAHLARSYGIALHTHLAENQNDIDYSLSAFGMLPGQYAESVGWVGDDVWHAHCVKLNDAEIEQFAHTHTGVCHCPTSNMRLASGIAPVRKMLDRGVLVGLGVDGTASNDSGHLLSEARQALLLQRVNENPSGLSAREAIHLATRGGADVLRRDDVGYLAPQMAADLIAYRLDQVEFAGALHDPVTALLFCRSVNVDLSIINGEVVVKDGQLTVLDLPRLIEDHNRLSLALIRGEA